MRIDALATSMKAEVVSEDRRVLVAPEREKPGHGRGIRAVQVHDLVARDLDGAAGVRIAPKRAPLRDHAERGDVEQRLTELRDLPIEDRGDVASGEEEIAVVVVAVHKDRRDLGWEPLAQARRET